MDEQQNATPPVAEVEFLEKVKGILALTVIVAFVVIALVWTFKAPQLPGDTAGMIVGGFIAVISSIGSYYWSITAKKDTGK